jgi:hypothetical protein
MCIQGLVKGRYNPRNIEHTVVILGKGEEYIMYVNNRYFACGNKLPELMVKFEAFLSSDKKFEKWKEVLTISINGFGYKVTGHLKV